MNWVGFASGFAGNIAQTQQRNEEERLRMRRELAREFATNAAGYNAEKQKRAGEVEQIRRLAQANGWSEATAADYFYAPAHLREHIVIKAKKTPEAGATPGAETQPGAALSQAAQAATGQTPSAASAATGGPSMIQKFANAVTGKVSASEEAEQFLQDQAKARGISVEEARGMMAGAGGVARNQWQGESQVTFRSADTTKAIADLRQRAGKVKEGRTMDFARALAAAEQGDTEAIERAYGLVLTDDEMNARQAERSARAQRDTAQIYANRSLGAQGGTGANPPLMYPIQDPNKPSAIPGVPPVAVPGQQPAKRLTPTQINTISELASKTIMAPIDNILKGGRRAAFNYNGGQVTNANPASRAQLASDVNARIMELIEGGVTNPTQISGIISGELAQGKLNLGAPAPQQAAQPGAPVNPAQARAEALQAIAAGAPREAVIQRLQSNGIDPTGL